jgi:hypothetical protein
MSVTCPACGKVTANREVCEFCNSPLGLSGQIAPPEVLPRLRMPDNPPLADDEEDLPVALPAPRRAVVPRPGPVRHSGRLEKPAYPAPRSGWTWRLTAIILVAVFVLLLGAVGVAELLARLRGTSIFGGAPLEGGRASTFAESQPSASQKIKEKARSQSVSDDTIDKILQLAKIKPKDVIIDLGCADGRLAVRAAELYGCGVYAWDNDPDFVKLARWYAEDRHQNHLIELRQTDDVLGVSLKKGNVIILLKPERFGTAKEVDDRLEPRLFELKPNVLIITTRVIAGHRPGYSQAFQPPDAPGKLITLYFYETPLD